VSFVKEYWNEVFSTLLTDYERGLTPNPDVLCNRYLKFGSFYKYATKELGADFIATGHYALTSSHHEGKVRLRRALDVTKDQTLFLSSIHQKPLQRTLFPLGNLYKVQVRQLAHQMGMQGLAKKRDSVGICFIGI
jgi:tRNA U34 2-thiouridine synthase MnmA/TrmU